MNRFLRQPIGDLCQIEKGSTGIASASPGEFPLVTTGPDRKTTSSYQFDTAAVCIPLVSSTGHGKKTLNYVHFQEGKFALGTILAAVIPKNPKQLSAAFLHRYLQFFKDRVIVPLMKGAANVSLAVKDIAKIEIPIPPIEEQARFVELFNRASGYHQEMQHEYQQQAAVLKTLRQTILQEAIEGKLTAKWREAHPVPKGDPEYDAAALLEQIKAEKQKLIVEGRIKKEKPLLPIRPDETPFQLPNGWVWCRLGCVVESVTYGTSQKCDYDEGKNSKVLRIPNVSQGYINGDDLKYADLSRSEVSDLALKEGDLLVIRSNGSTDIVGTMIYVPSEFVGYCYAGYLIRLRFAKIGLGRFVSLISKTTFMRKQIEDPLRTTVGINNINTQEISNLLIAFPPLAEQQAICERVEHILSMVFSLEAQVSDRKAKSEDLMQAVLREAFEGNSHGFQGANA